MLTKVVVRERAHSPSILSHGTQISMSSYNLERIMVKKNKEPEISSMLSGSQIFSWRESNLMETGLLCVPMSALDSLMFGEKNLKNYMKNMKELAEEEELLRHNGSGDRLLNHNVKLELLTCSTKITATENQTNKTSVLLRVQISVLRSLNIPALMK